MLWRYIKVEALPKLVCMENIALRGCLKTNGTWLRLVLYCLSARPSHAVFPMQTHGDVLANPHCV